MNVFPVQSLLGHSSLTKTRIYAEQVNSEHAIRAYKDVVRYGLDITGAILPLPRHRVYLGTSIICPVRKDSHGWDIPSLLKP